jgi:hypothetical protein
MLEGGGAYDHAEEEESGFKQGGVSPVETAISNRGPEPPPSSPSNQDNSPPAGSGRKGLRSPLLQGTETDGDDVFSGMSSGSSFPHRNSDAFASPHPEPRPVRPNAGLRSPLLSSDDQMNITAFNREKRETNPPAERSGRLHSPVLDGLLGTNERFEPDDYYESEEIDDPNVLRSPLLAAKSKIPAADKPMAQDKPPRQDKTSMQGKPPSLDLDKALGQDKPPVADNPPVVDKPATLDQPAIPDKPPILDKPSPQDRPPVVKGVKAKDSIGEITLQAMDAPNFAEPVSQFQTQPLQSPPLNPPMPGNIPQGQPASNISAPNQQIPPVGQFVSQKRQGTPAVSQPNNPPPLPPAQESGMRTGAASGFEDVSSPITPAANKPSTPPGFGLGSTPYSNPLSSVVSQAPPTSERSSERSGQPQQQFQTKQPGPAPAAERDTAFNRATRAGALPGALPRSSLFEKEVEGVKDSGPVGQRRLSPAAVLVLIGICVGTKALFLFALGAQALNFPFLADQLGQLLVIICLIVCA